jgi:hypothetical protein
VAEAVGHCLCGTSYITVIVDDEFKEDSEAFLGFLGVDESFRLVENSPDEFKIGVPSGAQSFSSELGFPSK